MPSSLRSLDFFRDSYEPRLAQLKDEREHGVKVVGTFCLYVPDEIIFAAGADRIVLCGGRTETIPVAEQSLPRNICPLIKSSFGAVVDACCGGDLSCPHVRPGRRGRLRKRPATGRRRCTRSSRTTYPTYVLDLPQKPGSPEALAYFLSELRKFAAFMEGLTGHAVTTDALQREIRSANETKRLLHRLFELRRRDPPPINGSDVLRVMQKQFFLAPDQFRQGVGRLCDEMEQVVSDARTGPRIMISGMPDGRREHESAGDHRAEGRGDRGRGELHRARGRSGISWTRTRTPGRPSPSGT